MKLIRLLFIILISWWISSFVHAQDEYIHNHLMYDVEMFGSAATGDNTPFWQTSNRYGTVPLEAGNGYMRGKIRNHQSINKDFYWAAGFDALVVAPRYRNAYIQQAFAEIGYKSVRLTVGSKEQYRSLFDKQLSSGDMMQSPNARPIPEIDISIPQFLTIPYTKGWGQIKGNMAVGRSFDTDYLEDFIQQPGQYYPKNCLWHHKSFFLRVKDTKGNFPAYASFGLRHVAQWGGTSTDPALGKQPDSFKDFIRIFFLKSGGEQASESDQVNALGAHHFAYDFHLGFRQPGWEVQGYHQHIASDKSGVMMYNGADGLWGLQLDLYRFPWMEKLVVEYITTRDQSGPFHFIWFDHDKLPGRGGGGDDYYNNGEYQTGHSYFNRSVGSPLVTSPEYNKGGKLGFLNNRIRCWHIGMEGRITTDAGYRILLTSMNGWGTTYEPFLKKRSGVSFLGEVTYRLRKEWSVSGSLAGDTGDYSGEKSFGFGLSIRKQGILRKN